MMDYTIDLFAIFIFLGIIQGVFLSFFFFSSENSQKQFHVFQGLLLLSTAACLLEIFLLYTGYVIHMLHLVDFSEPMALMIGPFLYLSVVSYITGKVIKRKIWVHLAFPLIYTITLLPFLFSSTEVKYNSWIDAFHPELPLLSVEKDPRIFFITDWHTELVLISLALYLVLSSLEVYKVFKEKKQSFFKPQLTQLKMLRNKVLITALFLASLFIVKLFNENDTGDHLFATLGALIIYGSSISVISSSGFFKQASLNQPTKYKSSALSPEQIEISLQKVSEIMRDQKPFLQPSFSLADLAKHTNLSIHALSQIINEGLNKSFFELIAEYRIEEAKKLLINQSHIKIEEIAEQVGYNSKSSFNTAFKKITNQTPSEFRAQHKSSSTNFSTEEK
jgi:AraC-like DNA-binding protein